MAEEDSSLYPAHIARLVTTLRSDDMRVDLHAKLAEYCSEHVLMQALAPDHPVFSLWVQQVCWLIEHAPDSKDAGGHKMYFHFVEHSPSDYENCKTLWLKQLERKPDDVRVLYNAARFLTHYDLDIAYELMERAYQHAPADGNIAYDLSRIYSGLANRSEEPSQSQAYKDKAFALGEQSLAQAKMLTRYYHLGYVADLALATGSLEIAAAYAHELLRLAEEIPRDWNYGNAVHQAHTVLGQLALRQGDAKTARELLLLAGQTPGSPQLNSFGPSMVLAKEFALRGDAATVIQYLELCRVFWENGQDQLQTWIEVLRQGKIPAF